MIRIREIPLPPEHTVEQLSYEAARLLKVSNSKIRQVRLVRRSVDARKKPDIRIVYTIDVKVDGNEVKILKQSGCKRLWSRTDTQKPWNRSGSSQEPLNTRTGRSRWR